MSERIAKFIMKISTKIKRCTSNLPSIKKLDEISGTNGLIIGYINKCNKQGIDVYQKDIEKELGITRSTASKIISLMEKKELIIRKISKNDARLRVLVLTQKAIELSNSSYKELIEFDQKLLTGFNEEERNQFLSYLNRALKNIEREDNI